MGGVEWNFDGLMQWRKDLKRSINAQSYGMGLGKDVMKLGRQVS